jgi:K+-transporting ATPase KdpF subunit
MTVLTVVAGALSAGLLCYLAVALLFPEKLQ